MAANRQKPPTRHHTNRIQLMALVLIGAGLILLGTVALLFLPKTEAQSRSSNSPSAIPVKVDFPAPELQLIDLKGSPVAISEYLGQVVLLNNWATWCPPCKAEMPVLEAYYRDYSTQGFTVIAIEAGEPVSQVAAFVQQSSLSFPVWPDPEMKALAAFRNDNLPNSYVIDRLGTVRLAWTGAITREVLEEYITPLLEQ